MGRDEEMRGFQEEWDHQKLTGRSKDPAPGGGSKFLKFIVIIVILVLIGLVVYSAMTGQKLFG